MQMLGQVVEAQMPGVVFFDILGDLLQPQLLLVLLPGQPLIGLGQKSTQQAVKQLVKIAERHGVGLLGIVQLRAEKLPQQAAQPVVFLPAVLQGVAPEERRPPGKIAFEDGGRDRQPAGQTLLSGGQRKAAVGIDEQNTVCGQGQTFTLHGDAQVSVHAKEEHRVGPELLRFGTVAQIIQSEFRIRIGHNMTRPSHFNVYILPFASLAHKGESKNGD